MSAVSKHAVRFGAALSGALLGLAALPTSAQDITPPGFTLQSLKSVGAGTPAKELFGRAATPSQGREESIGFYTNGCMAGGKALPISGPTWQVMRPSRNRYYGRTKTVQFIQRISKRVAANTSWPGLLIGDMSQPRGGPMLKGHSSHQIGLDVDIWLRPMPTADLNMQAREQIMSTNLVAANRTDLNEYYNKNTLQVLKIFASDPEVERVLVNPAIKRRICQDAGSDRAWLQKVRPVWGHDYHTHIRLGCTGGDASCRSQADVVPGDGCGKALDWWFTPGRLFPRPPAKPPKPAPPLTLAGMPKACTAVLNGP
ncbi:penicillin-insensitive murein endopeptidase [Methylopila sp. M107]|uniref:penicillin-insensitive murein endopeptidase n=1 Tax=Methylopila sp. M107 TaxID=1101190 RepID=UPI000360E415|nr:penicillin-insensitive murein endopeptidase [Methylopila sp. M107]